MSRPRIQLSLMLFTDPGRTQDPGLFPRPKLSEDLSLSRDFVAFNVDTALAMTQGRHLQSSVFSWYVQHEQQ